ncbi:hypothetical protein HK102_008587, partial [Quaeritorhiza haematococci]
MTSKTTENLSRDIDAVLKDPVVANWNNDPEGQRERMERELVRKMDRRIIPFIALLYLLSFLDRVNIGNARVVGFKNGAGDMERQLGLTASQYNWTISIFFFGYVLFEVPSNLMLKRATPSKWICRIMITWGICAT